MITTNRNIFLGIHITPGLKKALSAEVFRRKSENGKIDYTVSQSLVGYELLRAALIKEGYLELEADAVLPERELKCEQP